MSNPVIRCRFCIFEPRKHRDRLQQNFLHGVFGVFALVTHANAEGKDTFLEQSDSLVHRFRIAGFQKADGFLNFATHGSTIARRPGHIFI